MENKFSSPYFFHIFTYFLGLFLLIPSYANSSDDSIKVMVMSQTPYGFITKDGQKTGVLYDILNQIIKTSRIGKSISIVPTKRLVAIMKETQKVCTIFANSPDVSEFDYIEAIGFELTAGILPAKGIKLDNYSSLKNKVIAVPLGIIFDKKFHTDDTLIKVRPPHYINAIKMLKKGRVDAVAGALLTLRYIAKKEGMSPMFFDKPLLFGQANVYLVCTTNLNSSTREKLKKAVITLKSNGTIQRILTQYFGMNTQ